ncbi:SWIM-type domain-containing protein [Meloidogyne graminicola]|uniref:SWIM-type domain-containing protein n=1 Tax=Meloidogyne graminicola TaxID=189291 RepID=A0A8S9Z6T5_9BILA|nr:SWIM-type domain-containing protein [Meloidogyne graminicola]
MENYYCREFIVDTSRVLRTKPNRPLDSNGREAFVYIMDGAVAHTKKCKSTTRFNSVQHDNERNTLIFNRYNISNATSVLYKPACLFACYYCKHPVFDLVKKIFYACDGNRISCLPGTFVIFAYEFNKAEKIYRTHYLSSNSKTINVGNCSFAANTFIPNQQQFQQPIKSQNSSNNSFQRHFLESNTPLKLEDLTDWSTDLSTDQNGNYKLDNIQDDLTQQMTSTSSTTYLEEILQLCSEQVKNQQKIQRNESLFNNTDDYLNDSNNFLASNDDQNIISRKKRKITFQPISLENHQMPLILNKEVNNKLFLEDKIVGFNSPSSAAGDRSISPSSLQSVSVNADCNSRIEQISNVEENLLFNNYSNYLFTSDVLIENLRKNCFCDGKQLNEQFDFLNEQFLNISSFDGNQEEKLLNILKIANEQNNSFGGCLIIDKSFLIELDISIMITPIWFRNPFFLDKKNKQPVFHPVAIYLNIKNMTEDDCHKNILFELKKRLEEDLSINENICRSVFFCSTINLEKNPFIIINQLELLNSFSSLFSSPCIKLISIQQCKKWLRQNFLNLHFGNNNNNYEENDKKWNEEIENIFVHIESQLFDNKNGILQTLCFEQFISRLRSCERSWPYTFRSWFREKSDTILEPLREELCNNLTAALQGGSKGQFEMETVTEALELICTEYLRKSLKAFLENDSSSEIILSNSNNWIGHEHWEKLSEKERRDLLLPFGFSSLLNITDSLDPSIFWGLNRKQRRELISRANPLSVMVIDEIKKTNSNDNTSTTKNLNEIFTFVVIDVTKRIANFVQAIDNINNCSLYCQCLGGPLCEHILAVAIKHSSFAKIVPKLLEKSQSLNKSTNLKDNNNNSSSTPPLLMPGLQLNNTQSVEIICCSSSTDSI